MVLLFARYLSVFINMYLHAYYVSVTEIYHNPKTHSLEITMKIFIDDLEMAIRQLENSEIIIADDADNQELKTSLEAYLSDKFQIEINSKSVQIQMIGFELEDDAILCYIEIEKVKEISAISIRNTIITELHEDQINLTHFQYKGQLKSLKTTKASPDGTIDSSRW